MMVKKALIAKPASPKVANSGAPMKTPLDETASVWDSPKVRLAGISLLVVAFAFFLMNAIFGDNGWMVHGRQQRQINALKQEVNRLQKENQDIDKQIQGLRSDPKVIDRLAHDQLHLVAPNQTIYTLPEEDPKADPKRSATNPPATTVPGHKP
jgi:cell division protein FtsB